MTLLWILLSIYVIGFALFLWSFKLEYGMLLWHEVVLSALWFIWVPGTLVLFAAFAVWLSMARPESDHAIKP